MCLAEGVRPCEWRITQWEDQISVRQRYFLQAILPHQFPLEDARKVNLLSLLNYRPRIIGKNQKEEYKTNATVLLQTVIENFVSLKCLARCSSFLSSYQGSARCKDPTISRPEHRFTDKAKFVPQLSAFSPPLHCTGLGWATSGSCIRDRKSPASSLHMLSHGFLSSSPFPLPLLSATPMRHFGYQEVQRSTEASLTTTANRSKLPNRNRELNNLTLTEFVSEE